MFARVPRTNMDAEYLVLQEDTTKFNIQFVPNSALDETTTLHDAGFDLESDSPERVCQTVYQHFIETLHPSKLVVRITRTDSHGATCTACMKQPVERKKKKKKTAAANA